MSTHRTRGTASASSGERGKHPSRSPQTSLAQCVEASVRNAATLLEEGYRLIPSLLTPLTYLVFKPKQDTAKEAPAYQVELYYDPAEGDALQRRAWSYRCSCEIFRQQERRQTGEACRCKHGERVLIEWLFKWREVSAVLGYTPEIPETVNRFATAPTRDDGHPWPTQRAIRREEDFG